MSRDALELLLSGVKDQGQRKQITSAYYAFANGDPETFAVQFAVLLRAHAISLKLLPARLERSLAIETRKISELALATQSSVQRMVSLIDQQAEKSGVGEQKADYQNLSTVLADRLAEHVEALKRERERLVSTVTESHRIAEKLSARRIVLTWIFGYLAGLLTLPLIERLFYLFSAMLH